MRDDLDLHLHTARVGCANETMSVPALLARCEELGYSHIAITDHHNGPYHADAQRQIREDLRGYDGPLGITWGVELTVGDAAAETVTADEGTVREFAWEFVIAGPHGRYGETEPDAIIATQHRLMLATVRNPLVHALVHPWWFSYVESEPGEPMEWFTDMSRIPDRHVEELAEAAVETGTAIEMNGGAIIHHGSYAERFLDDYQQYMARLYELGANFTVASDAHDISKIEWAKDAARFLADAGVPDDRIIVPDATALS